MKRVIAVPHAEVQRRTEEQRKVSAANPNRRGPKPKKKREGHGPGVEPPV